MALFESKNPTLDPKTFSKLGRAETASDVMTVQGTIDKTGLLTVVLFAAALYSWNLTRSNFEAFQPFLMGGGIVGFILALVITFKKNLAPVLAPIYCAVQGLILGGISSYMDYYMPGIAVQAIITTICILLSMLYLYRTGTIRATEKFKSMVVSATMGIALMYLVSFIGSLIGFGIPMIHSNGLVGIGISLFIVAIAAMNLVLDFDFIEKGADARAPKYMEWYAAFGLMVTIIWLYIEVLRLLSKLRSRD